jgi:hypothetical protein
MNLPRTFAVAALVFASLRLSAASVSGTVVDAEGRAVVSATVTTFSLETVQQSSARWTERSKLASSVTDANGRFSIDTAEAVVDVLVTSDGFAPFMLRATPDDVGVVTLLRAELRRIRLAANGAPIVVIARGPSGAEVVAPIAEDGSYALPNPTVWVQTLTLIDKDHTRRTITMKGAPPTDQTVGVGHASFAGVIADGARKLAGVEVRLRDRAGSTLQSAITDASGAWQLDAVPAGSWFLDARRPGYAFDPLPITAKSGETTKAELHARPLARLSGKLLDGRGSGVPFARVIAIGEHAAIANAMSAPDGSYVLAAVDPEAPARVIATKNGYERGASSLLTLRGGEHRARLDVVMQQGVHVTGRIRDAEQRPVSDATVRFTHRDDPTLSDVFPAEVHPGSAGEVSVTLPRGRYRIRIDAPRFATTTIEMTVTDEAANFEATLQLAESVSGRVLRDGVGVEDVTIRAGEIATKTDHDGAFTLHDLVPGTVQLSVTKIAERIEETREASVPGDIVIEIDPGVTVSGIVIDSTTKKPLRTFDLLVRRDPASPGTSQRFDSADGAFTLEHMPRGAIVLTASAAGHASSTKSLQIDREPLDNLTLSLSSESIVRGRIMNSGGVAVSGALIALLASNGYRTDASSDDEGRYVLPDVPRGAVSIDVTHDDYLPARHELTVDAGDTQHDVTLQRGAELTGRVTTNNGPVAGAQITAVLGDNATIRTSNADGTFRFSLQRGRYAVSASKPGFATSATQQADVPGAAPLTLQLTRGGTLVGRVSGIVAGAEVTVVASGPSGTAVGHANAAGDFRIDDVPAGRTNVAAQMEVNGVLRATRGVVIEVVGGAESRIELGEWQPQ